MKPWKTIGTARTPDGKTLALAERDGVYALRVDGVELMTTRQSASEEKLAELGCGPLARRVLVGGLGFSFTLRASLTRLPADARVVVAELMPQVVEWNREVLKVDVLTDPRVQIEVRDVADLIAHAPARGYDAILLDVDNGPVALTQEKNHRLYSERGLALAARALRKDGRFAVWSVAEAPSFLKALERAGFRPEAHRVTAHTTGGGQRWIYLGKL